MALRPDFNAGMAKSNAKTKDKLLVDVVETVMELHRRRLWERVDSHQPISIRVDGEEHPLVCFVLGSASTELGVSVLRGEHAMEVFEEDILNGVGCDSDSACDMLMLSFEARSNVLPEFLRPLGACGRVFGKDASVPVFISLLRGQNGRVMSRPELRILLGVVKTLLAAASSGQLQPREWDWRRRALELRLEGKGKQAKVVDSVVTWPMPRDENERELELPTLGLRWYKVTKEAARTQETWHLTLLPWPGVEGNPCAMQMLLIVDADTDAVHAHKVIEANDADGLLDAFLDAVESDSSERESGQGLPSKLCFLQQRPERQLRVALDEIGVQAEFNPDQPALESTLERITQALEEAMEADGLLDADVESESIDVWKQVDHSLTDRLIESSGANRGTALEDHPLDLYFGDADAGRALLGDGQDETSIVSYFEWYLINYRVRRGARTAAEKLLRKRGLPPMERTILEARIAAKTIVARVVSIDPGASVDVENCLNGEVLTIHDMNLSKTAEVGLGLITRVMRVKEWNFASLAGPVTPMFHIKERLRQIEAIGHEFSEGVLIGEHEAMGSLFFDSPAMPSLHNTDGEEIEPLVVSFTIKGKADIASVLSTIPEMKDEEDGTWIWLVTGSGKPEFENGVVIAHFEQVGDELLASVNSAPRALRVKDLLKSRKALKFRSIGPAPSPEGGASPEPDDLPPELLAEMKEFLHSKIMAWLDEPVPALGGKTPRQAAKEPMLRQEVEQMIRTYPDSGSPAGLIRAPRKEMLKELGF